MINNTYYKRRQQDSCGYGDHRRWRPCARGAPPLPDACQTFNTQQHLKNTELGEKNEH